MLKRNYQVTASPVYFPLVDHPMINEGCEL
jgi:hypothetical protein